MDLEVLSFWSDRGAQSRTIVAPATNATYPAVCRKRGRRGPSRTHP